MSILTIDDLSINFRTAEGVFSAVKKASIKINKGEFVALVGQSGSGKSVLALSILGLLPSCITSYGAGKIIFAGQNLLTHKDTQMRNIRGNKISMIFQEPMTALNPLHTIEKQISEVLFIHKKMNKKQAKKRCVELLKMVGLQALTKRLDAYPHNLSGGQRQRVMIAMALANEPDLLIADEPTTALDVTIQAQILELLHDIQKETGMSILFITHNLNIVKRMAKRIYVMKQGKIIEGGTKNNLFKNAEHPYTKDLLATQKLGKSVKLNTNSPILLETNNLSVSFPLQKNFFGKVVKSLQALQNANLSIQEGQTIGIVGESGSGKTTLAMAILRLIAAKGQINFQDIDLSKIKGEALRKLRKKIQIVFQDPFASLNPRMTIAQIISEGLIAHSIGFDHKTQDQMVLSTLKEVGLDKTAMNKFPHEFSGGQRQRIAIARALILDPKLIILDEPTSALDVTTQAQIIALLKSLQEKRKISYLFISHDLAVVRAISHNIIVMKNGKIIETNTTNNIFSHPEHDYTVKLINASLL